MNLKVIKYTMPLIILCALSSVPAHFERLLLY